MSNYAIGSAKYLLALALHYEHQQTDSSIMQESGLRAENTSVEELGIKDAKVYWNLSAKELANHAVANGQATKTNSGAIAVDTGEFTGRSPKDRYIVKDEMTKDAIWWSTINLPFDADKFDSLYNKVVVYLSGKVIYVRDAYACADPK